MASTEKLDFVNLSDENMHHLIPLYKKVFGQNYSLSQIKSKYALNYTGIAAKGHFAFDNGNPVAFHGAIPINMRYKNTVELAAQYGDAMTLPKYTGKGLFTKLGKLTDNVLIKSGVRFVWGFPNQNSEYGYVNKLNWQGSTRMKYLIIKTNQLPKEGIFRKLKFLDNDYQLKVEKALDSVIIDKRNLCSINTNEFVCTDRSDGYYNYKSFTPNYMVQLPFGKAWIKPIGGLLVGDMEVKDTAQVNSLLNELIKLSKKLSLGKVIIQASPNSLLFNLLSKDYNFSDSWLIGSKNFNSDLPLDRLELTYGDLDTF